MERRRCDGPPNFWPTLRTNPINLRQNFICEITTQPSIFLFPHYITFHNFASLLSGSRIFLFPFPPFSRNFFPSCQTPTQTILRNLLVLVPLPRIAISPIRDLSLRLSFFFGKSSCMNWFGKLDLSSNLNFNHFVTCLLVFSLHFSPQSLSNFHDGCPKLLLTDNHSNLNRNREFYSQYGVKK